VMQSIERRSRPRNEVSCLVKVRQPGLALTPVELAFMARNTSPDSLYFIAENHDFPEKMNLCLTFPFNPDPSAVHRDCMVEVVRADRLARGRFGVAARLLDNIRTRFRLLDGLIVPESTFLNQSWSHLTPQLVNIYA
jgi:hypothetical protein